MVGSSEWNCTLFTVRVCSLMIRAACIMTIVYKLEPYPLEPMPILCMVPVFFMSVMLRSHSTTAPLVAAVASQLRKAGETAVLRSCAAQIDGLPGMASDSICGHGRAQRVECTHIRGDASAHRCC
jgi:hypothetical protein